MTTPEIQAQEQKLANLEKLQARYKAINNAYRNFVKKPESLDASTLEQEEKDVVRYYKPKHSSDKGPIEPWRMSNNNAVITSTKKRIAELVKRETELQAAGGINKEFEYEGFTIVHNFDESRVQIIHDSKPDASVIEKLKRNGFNWSPTNGAWQRLLNDAGKNTAEYVMQVGDWSPEKVAEREHNRPTVTDTPETSKYVIVSSPPVNIFDL